MLYKKNIKIPIATVFKLQVQVKPTMVILSFEKNASIGLKKPSVKAI